MSPRYATLALAFSLRAALPQADCAAAASWIAGQEYAAACAARGAIAERGWQHREQRGTEIAAFLLGSNLHVPVAGSFVESLASVGMPVAGLRTNTVLPFQSCRYTVNVCANSSEAAPTEENT